MQPLAATGTFLFLKKSISRFTVTKFRRQWQTLNAVILKCPSHSSGGGKYNLVGLNVLLLINVFAARMRMITDFSHEQSDAGN